MAVQIDQSRDALFDELGLMRLRESYRRYLEGFFREKFDLAGTPLRIEFRTKENPFVKDDNKR